MYLVHRDREREREDEIGTEKDERERFCALREVEGKEEERGEGKGM